MDDQFREVTKDNGLKDVTWGSDEFIKTIQKLAQEETEEQNHYDYCLSILKGM